LVNPLGRGVCFPSGPRTAHDDRHLDHACLIPRAHDRNRRRLSFRYGAA
jgi:hypothetical protein